MRHGGGEAQERDLDVAAEQIIDRGSSAAIGDVDDVDAGLLPQELAGKMMRRAGAGRTVMQLAGIGPGISNHIRHGLRRKLGVDRETDDIRAGIDDGGKILYRIERRTLVEIDIGGHHRVGAHHQRVTVGLCAGHICRGDVAADARAVVHDDGLAPCGIEPFADRARDKIAGGARRVADDDGHGPRGVILRRGGNDQHEDCESEHRPERAEEREHPAFPPWFAAVFCQRSSATCRSPTGSTIR